MPPTKSHPPGNRGITKKPTVSVPFIGWLLAIVAAGRLAAADQPVPRYNVLLVIADDLRPALGCYGDRQARTPNIDRLAARGVRFERAYVQYPVCNPSRTSLLTGTRPERNGVVGNGTFFRQKMPEIVTLPQWFRRHGAQALSFGKIYHAGLVEGVIETNLLDIGRSWDEARMFSPTPTGSTGRRRNLTFDRLKWCEVGDMEGGDDDQSDGQTASQAVEAMGRLRDRRWFIGAGFHRPHDPFVVARPYVEQFPAGSLRLHRDPVDASPLLPISLAGGAFAEAFARFDDRDRMDFLTHYYAGTSQTDAQVGRLMRALDRLKLWDSTVVVFIGDHGYHLGERGWWNKNTLFERSCRAPLIIVAPGIRPGVSRSLVEFTDLYPTIAALCGLGAPSSVEGIDLRPVLLDPSHEVHDAAITHVVRGAGVTGFSIRTDRWRYTEWDNGRGGVELYDHRRDPEEWHDVSTRADLQATRSQLASILHRRIRIRPPENR